MAHHHHHHHHHQTSQTDLLELQKATKNTKVKSEEDFDLVNKRRKKVARPKSKFNPNNEFPVYEADACGCLKPDHFVRRNAIKLVHSQAPFRLECSCTLRGILWPFVRCGCIKPKRLIKTSSSLSSLMKEKEKLPLLDRVLSFLWTFDRTIILLIIMNCFFLAISTPFPTCCRAGAESNGMSTKLVKASFFAQSLESVRHANSGLRDSPAIMDLLKQPSGNETAIRCVMGGEVMVNMLEHRSELIDGDAVKWYPTSIPCCVDRQGEGIVPMAGVDIPVKCADWDDSYTAFVFNWIFTICFTIELFIQVTARGWCGDKPNKVKNMPGSYLTSAWFVIDFIVVVVSFLSEIPGVGNVSALRTFRVLRPLRTLTAIPSMRALINSLFKSLPNMQYVVMMMLFLPIVFGVIAVQLWGGLLRGRCHYLDNSTGVWIMDEFQDDRICALKYLPRTLELYNNQTKLNDYYAIGRQCDIRKYGNDTWSVEALTMDCQAAENPNYGETHFEKIGVAMLWIFADITLEGWVDNMYMINDAFSHRSEPAALFVNLYFTLMVLLGGFFMLNLALAVVWDNYQKESEAAEKAILDGEMLKEMERDRNILFRWKNKAKRLKKRRASQAANLMTADFPTNATVCAKDDETTTVPEVPQEKEKIVVGEPNVVRKTNTFAKPPPAFGPDGNPTGFIMSSKPNDGNSIFAMVAERKKERDDEAKKRFEKSCVGCIKKAIEVLVLSNAFTAFITICILLNTIFMAIDYSTPETNYFTPPQYRLLLYWLNETCSIVFLLEMLLKLIGIGWKSYSSDNFNLFDMAIVFFSIFEWILLLTGGGVAVSGLSVFRLFRVMRILKLAKSWPELNNLIRLIALSVGDVTSAALLLFVIMFIFSIIGIQLFGGKWNAEIFYPDDPPRANFDELGWSLVTVFQVLSGENWNEVLWAGMKASGAMAAVYFLALNIGGGFIILNLFLAILLARFEPEKEPDEDEEQGYNKGEVIKRESDLELEREQKKQKEREEKEEQENIERQREAVQLSNSHTIGGKTKEDATKVRPEGARRTTSLKRVSSEQMDIDRMILPGTLPDEDPNFDRRKSFNFAQMIEDPPEDEVDQLELSGTALGMLGVDNTIRTYVFAIISNKKFEGLILFLIGISSLMLAMDEPWVATCACFDPADPSTHYDVCDTDNSNGKLFTAHLGSTPGNSKPYLEFLLYSDLVITIIFVIEMILKLIGLGIYRSKTAYFRSGWNTLDFLIVIISAIGLFTGPLMTGICVASDSGGGILKALRSMRALRALRPLRVVRRYPALRLVVSSIFKAGPAIANVLIVMTLFFMIFAIYGSQRWMGMMAACNDPSIESFAECTGDFLLVGTGCRMLPTPTLEKLCILNGDYGMNFTRRWESFPANFDHVGNGFLTVFELASGEMWPDIMYYTVDAVAVNTSQIENWNRAEGSIFHILVQLVCSFLMVNVFIGVVIEKYNENKEISQGAGMLTNKQKLWLESMKLALSGNAIRQDTPPEVFWRLHIFNFIKLPFFEGFIMLCIVLNTCVLMTTSFDEGLEKEKILETLNLVFTYIFSVEFALKFIGLGKQYFFTSWNIFDFVLVILSWVGQFFNVGPIASLFRVFRVLRMIRLVRTQKGLLNLFKTLIFSLPALANITCIVILFMFIFSCIAMNLFANIKLQGHLTDNANFQTFFRSFNTLWRYVFCSLSFSLFSTHLLFCGRWAWLYVAVSPAHSNSAPPPPPPTLSRCMFH